MYVSAQRTRGGRSLVVGLAAAALLLGAIGFADAETAPFEATVTIEQLELSISVDPTSYDFGLVEVGGFVPAALATTVTNDGDVHVDELRLMYVGGLTDAAQCETGTWDASLDDVGADTFLMGAHTNLNTNTNFVGSGANLLGVQGLAPNGGADVSLGLEAPTSITTEGECSIALEFIASAD